MAYGTADRPWQNRYLPIIRIQEMPWLVKAQIVENLTIFHQIFRILSSRLTPLCGVRPAPVWSTARQTQSALHRQKNSSPCVHAAAARPAPSRSAAAQDRTASRCSPPRGKGCSSTAPAALRCSTAPRTAASGYTADAGNPRPAW